MNPRLLENRRGEILMALDAIDDGPAPARHALVLGEARTGRTSVLQEIGRRLRQGTSTLVVEWRLTEDTLSNSGVVRGLFSAVAEALLEGTVEHPAWYQAWCDRVYLRDRSPMASRDLLVSALAFAGDDAGIVDPAVVVRDLKAFANLARDRAFSSIAVVVDDADVLLEDTDLLESVTGAFAAAGAWHLIMASRFSGASHLVEAASPALREIELVPLRRLWLPNKIRACFTAPLDGDEADRLMPNDSSAFLSDVLHLTSGNPFELALVGHHLWFACRLGEQEIYELTPKVVDRVLSDFERYTGASPEMRAGARAVRELPPARMSLALDLVALTELTTRQVAIARMLGLPNSDDSVNERLLTCDLDAEEAKVVTELRDLERHGVVTLEEDGHFSVQGGRQAAIALKYRARSFAGQRGERAFGIPYIACVGDPLAELCASQACEMLGGVQRVATGKVLSPSTYASAARIRTALEARPFTGLEISLRPVDKDAYETVAGVIAGTIAATIAVVNFTITVDDEDFNLVEVWVVSDQVDSHAINQTLSDAVDRARPLIEKAELTWNGASQALLRGEAAQDALILLCPDAAEHGLRSLYSEWTDKDPGVGPEQAANLAAHIVDVLRTQRPADAYELSGALSRYGFMLLLCAGREAEAIGALSEALDRGPADGWVTDWNLVALEAHSGQYAAADTRLRNLRNRLLRSTNMVFLSFFVPGRSAARSLLSVSPANARPIYELQTAVLAQLSGSADRDALDDALADCAESDPEGMKAAKWVLDAFGSAPSAPSDRKTGGTGDRNSNP